MAPVRRLPKDEWSRKLRSYGCYPAEGLGPLNSAEWWRWPFKGPPFTVPVDTEGYCDMQAFQRLISDMARLAPPDFEFHHLFEP